MSQIERIKAVNERDHLDDYSIQGYPTYNRDTNHETDQHELKLKTDEIAPLKSAQISPWWLHSTPPKDTTAPAEKMDQIAISSSKPISPIPVLDEPKAIDLMPTNLDAIPLSSPLLNAKEDYTHPLSEKDLAEGLSRMSDKTMEQIMSIVYKAQLEIERERAIGLQSGFERLEKMKTVQQKMVSDVKDALAHDEKVAGYFKTAEYIAIAAAAVCGIAALCVSFGFLPPAAPLLVSAITKIAAVGPYVTAAFTALTAGGKTYTDVRINQDKAELARSSHEQKKYSDQISDQQDQVGLVSETDAFFKEELMKLMKRQDKMMNIVMQK